MADNKQPVNIFHRLDFDRAAFPRLKPLSIYSRTIICDDVASACPGLSWTRNSPFRNLKVRLVNSGASGSLKRRMDDSCLDETYETPPKKPCLAKSDSVFPATHRSQAADGVENARPNINDKSGPSVLPVRTMLMSSRDDNDGVALGHVQDIEGAMGPSPRFDFDVDGILCLSPIESDGASTDGLEDFIQSCQSFYEEQQSQQSFGGPKQHQGVTAPDEGYVTKCYRTLSAIKSSHVTGDAVDGSEGRVTEPYETTSPKGSKDAAPPAPPQSQTIYPVMSTPLAKFLQLGKCPLLLKPNLPPKEQQFSPIENPDLSLSTIPSVCTNTAELPIIPILCSTGNRGDEVLTGGTSIHQSACPQLSEDGHVLSVSQQPVELGEETFWERSEASDSFESTLPLQVKSKVVLVRKPEEAEASPSVPAAAAEKELHREPPESKEPPESQRNVLKEVQRPVVFSREEDWEREKKVYVNSVTRHVKDNAGAGGGVMDELLHLMNAVANQGGQGNGRTWQHPSDLTRRSYQLRTDGRSISLDEWHDLSCPKFRRFAQVPQVFKRSPVL